MRPAISRLGEGASRPPTGPPQPKPTPGRNASSPFGSNNGGSDASSTSDSSRLLEFGANDDSSCDDTYVSMSSSRGRGRGSRRILQETTRLTNKPKPRSSSSLRNFSEREENSSTMEILDKLKRDINSLEILRQTAGFSDNHFFTDANRRQYTVARNSESLGSDFVSNDLVEYIGKDSPPTWSGNDKTSECSSAASGAFQLSENDKRIKTDYGTSRSRSSTRAKIDKSSSPSAKMNIKMKNNLSHVSSRRAIRPRSSVSVHGNSGDVHDDSKKEASNDNSQRIKAKSVKRKPQSAHKLEGKVSPSSLDKKPSRSRSADLCFRHDKQEESFSTTLVTRKLPIITNSAICSSSWQTRKKESEIKHELSNMDEVLEREDEQFQVLGCGNKMLQAFEQESDWLAFKGGNERKAFEQENDKLQALKKDVKRLQFLEKENDLLHTSVNTLKEDSMKNIEDLKVRHLREFSHVKQQLENSKSKEEELESALIDLVHNVESEQDMISDELLIAHKLRESEVALLDEKLRIASSEVEVKSGIIEKLQSDMYHLEKTLREEKKDAEKNLCKTIESLKFSNESSETGWVEKVTNLEAKLRQTNDKLSNAENRNRTLHESSDRATEEGNKAITALKASLKEAQEENHMLNNIINADKKAIGNLELSLSSAAEEGQKVNKKLNDLQVENAGLKTAVDEKEKANNQIRLGLAELRLARGDLEIQLKDLRAASSRETQKFAEEKADIERKFELLEQEKEEEKVDALNSIRLDMERELQAVQQDRDIEREAAVDKTTKLENELHQKITDLGSMWENKLQEETNNLKATHELEMLQLNQEKKMEMDKFKETCDSEKQDKEEEINKLKENLNQLKARWKNELEEQNHKMKAMDEARQEKDALIKGQSATISQMEAEMKSNINKYKIESDQHLMTTNKVRDLNSQIEVQNSTISRYSTKTKTLQCELERTRTDLGESSTKASIMEQEIFSLQCELERTRTSLRSDLLSVNTHLKSSNEFQSKLQKENEALSLSAKSIESKLNDSIKTLKLDLDNAKTDLEKSNDNLNKVKRESATRNGQLKSALQSLDEMMKYIESIREENDDAVASLEEAIMLECKANKKLLKELEACRIDAIKELSKAKDDHGKKIAQIRKNHLKEQGRKMAEHSSEVEMLLLELKNRSSQVNALSNEVQMLRGQSDSNEKIKRELEHYLQERCSEVESVTVELNKLREQSFTDRKINQKLEASLQEYSCKAKSLTAEVNALEKLRENDGKVKKEMESSLKENSSKVESLTFELEQMQNRSGKIKEELESQVESLTLELKQLLGRSDDDGKIKDELETLLQVRSAEYDRQIKELEASIEQKSLDSKSLLQTIDGLKAENDELNIKCQEESKIKEYEDEISQVASRLKCAQRENATQKALLEKSAEDVSMLRGEVAQKKQMIAILQSNEKHLEEHVASLEEQIDKLVSEYEIKLQNDCE